MAGAETTVKRRSNRHCCVPYCVSDGRHDSTIYFHKFPKNNDLRKQWVFKIRRDEGPMFKISSCTVVCSKHFESTDYKWTPFYKTLKAGTVPSVFDWTKESTPRRAIKRKIVSPVKRSVQEHESSPVLGTSYEGPSAACSTASDQTEHLLSDNAETNDQKEVKRLKLLLDEETNKCQNLEKQLRIEKFGINRFSNDDSMILFYTGFVTYTIFLTFYRCIEYEKYVLHYI